MSTFARIVEQNGVSYVAELFVEPDGRSISDFFPPIFVWNDVSDVNPPPQPGWVFDGTGYAPAPFTPVSRADMAGAKLRAGCATVSTSNAALNGTYPVDSTTTNKAASVSLYIQVNQKFPGGLTEFPWFDIDGEPHLFTSTAAFQAAATGWADYVTNLDLYGAALASNPPAQPITIP